jgi:hypothetical protein
LSHPSTWRSKIEEEFEEMNEEVGVVIASAGGGVGEVQEEEYGTAD